MSQNFEFDFSEPIDLTVGKSSNNEESDERQVSDNVCNKTFSTTKCKKVIDEDLFRPVIWLNESLIYKARGALIC